MYLSEQLLEQFKSLMNLFRDCVFNTLLCSAYEKFYIEIQTCQGLILINTLPQSFIKVRKVIYSFRPFLSIFIRKIYIQLFNEIESFSENLEYVYSLLVWLQIYTESMEEVFADIIDLQWQSATKFSININIDFWN